MIDWNSNGKIDPVDIGISIAMDSQEPCDSVNLLGYSFTLVQELEPNRSANGQIRQYMPHVLYSKWQTAKLHKYGIGPFCRLFISRSWYGASGVYALFDTQQLLYIGQCKDLAQRYNTGYGTISPRNCYEGGQLTNCKINSMILRKYLNGDRVFLYFCRTDDYNSLEHMLIEKFQPLYNGHVDNSHNSLERNATVKLFIRKIIRKEEKGVELLMKKASLQSELLEHIKVGDIFDNPGGGTSVVVSVNNEKIGYVRKNSAMYLTISAFIDTCSFFQGKRCSTSDLKKYNPEVFSSKHNGHDCHCTFLFSLAERLGLLDGSINGSGKRGDPFYVLFR
jgi:hypothetical protein